MSQIIQTRKERIAAVLEDHGVIAPNTDELINDLLTHALSDTVCDWQAKTGKEPEKVFVLDDPDFKDSSDDFHRNWDSNFYIPGEGFGVKVDSSTRGADLRDQWAERFHQVHGHGPNEGRFSGGRSGVFISEEKLMGLVACYLNHHRCLEDDAQYIAEKHLGRTVEGFDTRDSSKDENNPFDRGRQDYFDINRSQSTIHIGVASGEKWLNGSMTKHQHFILMEITGPTGRRICEVEMSMDQFANALVGNSHTPCTIGHYWSVNEFNRQLTERVKPPETISDRLKKRLRYAKEENAELYQPVLEALRETAESGKMGKVRARELVGQLERALGNLSGHAEFVLSQSTEEATSMLEQAAIFFKQFYGVPVDELRKLTPIGHAFGGQIDAVQAIEGPTIEAEGKEVTDE